MKSQENKKLNKDFSAISRGRELAQKEKEADEKDIEEEVEIEADYKYAKRANEHLFLGLREKYGNNIIRFLWSYSFFALFLIIFDGFSIWGFSIPDNAIVALISGAAVSALGVVGTVAAGLFKPPTK